MAELGLHDWWVSECVPCQRVSIWDTEDEAISDAERHVANYHADTNPDIRGQERIGHVQLRTITPGSNIIPASPAPALMDADPSGSAIVGAGLVDPERTLTEQIAALIKRFIPAKE